MEWLNIVTTVAAVIGIVVGSAGYLKYVATKANIDGKDQTIDTLQRQKDAEHSENVSLREENAQLKGENKTLREIATQTPEIIKLTESVTHLTDSVNTQSNQTAKAFKDLVALLTKERKEKRDDARKKES